MGRLEDSREVLQTTLMETNILHAPVLDRSGSPAPCCFFSVGLKRPLDQKLFDLAHLAAFLIFLL